MSYVINNLLLNSADLQCGCLCTQYTTPDGTYSWSFSNVRAQPGLPLASTPVCIRHALALHCGLPHPHPHSHVQASNTRVNAANITVWKNPLTDNSGNIWNWFDGQLTCSGGRDTSKCSSAYSEISNLGYCPNTNPREWPPTVYVPNPPYRAGPAAGVADDPAWTESWQDSSKSSNSPTGGYSAIFNASRAAPFLYTSASGSSSASGIAQTLFFDAATLQQVQNLAANTVVPSLGFSNPTNNHANITATLVNSILSSYGAAVDQDLSRTVEVIPKYPVQPFLIGSAAPQQQFSLQSNAAWQGKPLMLLLPNCAAALRGVNVTGTTIPLRKNLQFVGLMFNSNMSCVSVPGLALGNLDAVNAALFTGYGKGSPTTLGVLSTPAGYAFALDFQNTNAATAPASRALAVTVIYNGTLVGASGQPANTFFPAQGIMNRVTNAFLHLALGGQAGPNGTMRFTLRYMRDMPTQGAKVSLDVGTFLGPLFYTWLSQMLLPVMVSLLVYEKEKNLRIMMKIQGLGDNAYIFVNYAYYFVLYFAFMLLIYFYGYVLGKATDSLTMWTLSSPGPVIVFFILFFNVQIAIAYLFQAVFANAKTATVASVVYLLISGLLGRFLFQSLLESNTYSRSQMTGLEIVPPFALYRGFYEMATFGNIAAYNSPGQGDASIGLSWPKITKTMDGMATVMVIFVVEWFVIGLLAWYLDQVLSSGNGIKRHPLFFLDFLLKKRIEERARALTAAAELAVHQAALADKEEPDVAAAREEAYNVQPQDTYILARGLSKTYPGQDGGPPKVACRELSVSIPAGECFGLLGPNGAGKSTAINLLIGFLRPTRGSAYIGGYNLQQDLDTVYSMLGVCPQHDLLWEQLSAREHLRFYGRLKNLSGAALEAACSEALMGVNLYHGGVGDRPCGTYSGGMKRRLSVAISLMGNPPVVFLDEPSTGLDPASRATLWDVIKEAKKRHAIVLTTHAMEEAEELCDRLGIFVDGAMRCVGNPKELTSRYGGFLVLTITAVPARAAESEAFIRSLVPGAVLTYKLGGTMKFDLPLEQASLASIFTAVKARQEALGIVDWSVANMTLEEVFIKLARSIGAETKD